MIKIALTKRIKAFALMSSLLLTSSVFAADEQLTLNLRNADINSLIETVSQYTGYNFVVDPRVKAENHHCIQRTYG